MAYYNYKNVRDLLPKNTADKYKEKYGEEYEGEPNYDGDMWVATADYIEELKAEIERLNALVAMKDEALAFALWQNEGNGTPQHNHWSVQARDAFIADPEYVEKWEKKRDEMAKY